MALISKKSKLNLNNNFNFNDFVNYVSKTYNISKTVLNSNLGICLLSHKLIQDTSLKDIKFEEIIINNDGNYELQDIKKQGENLIGEPSKKVSNYFDDSIIIWANSAILLFFATWIGVDDDYNLIYLINHNNKNCKVWKIK